MVPLQNWPVALTDAVRRGRDTRMLSSTVPVQVWAHRPQAALAWLALLDQLHNHGVLDGRLRELVRLRIAAFTNCQACQLARKSDAVDAADLAALACQPADSVHFSPAEREALRYAELFAADPHAITETHFEALARHFSIPQIVELQMFCALMLAGGRMTLVQRAYEDPPA
ncbi:MAG: carboxymuconolactone decarboxylase [Burkholderiales bacterium RIFCSPHIGHO2_12_FULL_69_20]|nr:MAG: carboxymuconolactone decarboxylase [Burkholderiales bacterium RIFCSPHIGHO2_12_FULL_69_20]